MIRAVEHQTVSSSFLPTVVADMTEIVASGAYWIPLRRIFVD